MSAARAGGGGGAFEHEVRSGGLAHQGGLRLDKPAVGGYHLVLNDPEIL